MTAKQKRRRLTSMKALIRDGVLQVPAVWEGQPVTVFDQHALTGCKDLLKAVLLPEGVEEIAKDTFLYQRRLLSVNLPTTLRRIGDYAFHNSADLVSAVLPEGLESIGTAAFMHCRKLCLVLPASLETVPTDALLYVKQVDVSPENPRFASDAAHGLYTKNGKTLLRGPVGDRVTVPDGVERIGEDAFYNRPTLTAVTLPASLKRIDSAAFLECNALTELTLPPGVETLGAHVFPETDTFRLRYGRDRSDGSSRSSHSN